MTTLVKNWPTDHIQFVVASADSSDIQYCQVPVADSVQGLLEEMLQTTLDALGAGEIAEYEFAERYESVSALQKSLEHDELEVVRALTTVVPSDIKGAAIDDSIFFYLVRFYAADGQCLTGVRRATYFKSVLKQRHRLIRIVDDTLTSVQDNLFKLDWDFDFLLTPSDVFILRPSNFEAIAGVDEAIAVRIPEKVKDLQTRISFLGFDTVAVAAGEKKRVARMVASIASRTDLETIDKDLFLAHATQTHVVLNLENGRYVPTPESVRAMLEILDRRRYHMNLSGAGEAFVAGSRQAVSAKK